MKKWTALLLASLLVASAHAEIWRLGHVTPPSHIWHKVSLRFNENLQKEMQNRHQLKIYPLSKLGGDDQMVQLLQSGAIQFAILTAGNLSNRSPSMNAWFLPYTFDNMEQATAAVNSPEARQLLAELEQHKLVGLGYTLAGMRHVVTTQPVNHLNDFRGQKIRSFPNPLFNLWWRKLDAAPTALAISDVMPSLTTNLINGVDADLDIVVGMKMYHQAPYLTLTNHMTFPGVVVVSKPWWDKLSETERTQIRKAFAEAEQWGSAQQNQQEKNNIETLKKAGVTVNEPDYAALKAAGQPIAEAYASKHPSMLAFYRRFAKHTKQ
ncbi:MAG: TRAP transporter substrate-binding protein [Alysiella sp.]|uniref:TRAP transporter substrate-binding protein n=1 Tax=Alysiella sp. TaxID=1872483 RepID=UPI0026DD2F88|nr:TRAP transporter substrate-binding protein [Alysiella sp.]MDO4434411.1 TRAP transporter substrate-binding protein [Alysiella sp.]